MASSKPFAQPPSASTLTLHPFKSHIPQADITRLKRQLENAEDIPTAYENSFAPDEYELGVKKGWVEEMLGIWKADYEW